MFRTVNPIESGIAKMLEDLNGTGRPHGLRTLVKERLGIDSELVETPSTMVKAYTVELRSYVDLWLDHRKTLEQKRVADKERLELRRQLSEMDKRWSEIVAKSQAARKQRQTASTKRYQAELATLSRESRTLEKKIDSAYWKPTKGERARAIRIQDVLEDIAEGHRLFPASLDDGYSLVIKPTFEFMHTHPPQRWPASPAPTSHIDEDRYATHDEYVAALLKERLGTAKASSLKVASPLESAAMRPFTSEDAAQKAAQVAFARMLISDWRRRIAKCESPSCKAPYFPLGKWNTDHKASLCLACRKGVKGARNQERMENNREKARQALFALVAERFAERITGEWYKDAQIKRDVARTLNTFLRNPPDSLNGPLRNLYPKGVTKKWLTSSHRDSRGAAPGVGSRDKNWQWVEAKAKRRRQPRGKAKDRGGPNAKRSTGLLGL